MKYRRSKSEGATYFFTVVTYRRKRILCDNFNAALVKEAFTHIATNRPFKIDAFVMLPDHIHSVWTLPDGDNDYSTRWTLIKMYFTKRCDTRLKGGQSDNMKKKGLQGVWQQRFWEHQIRDDRDFAAHVDYIHYNPVKHSLAERPVDWKYSSFHKYVKEGIYDKNWGAMTELLFDDSIGNE